MSKPIADFYSTHGRMSDPGKHLHLYEVLPSDVAQVTQIIQGLLLHRSYATFHGVTDAELSERKNEEQIYAVEDLLDLLLHLETIPLANRRHASQRALVNCRHFALLLCSFLRHNAVPARIRVGFMRYGTPKAWPIYYSHYITEYWDPPERQWIRTDSQIYAVQKKVDGITVDTRHLPDSAFLSGDQTWQLCRSGNKKVEEFGIGPEDNGWGFVKSHLLHDWMALNKMPLLPWHGNEFMHKPGNIATKAEFTLLDKAASVICEGDESFAEMRSVYKSSATLSMPANWQPPRAESAR